MLCVFEMNYKKKYMRKLFYKVFGLSKINIQKLLNCVKGFYFYIIFSYSFIK